MTTTAVADTLRELARQTDRQLAEVGSQIARHQRSRTGHIARLRDLLGVHKDTAAEDVLSQAHRCSGEDSRIALRCNEIATIEESLADLLAERAALDDVYAANGGWSRFFLVSGGHIHASTACSTCNKGETPTEFGWLTDLSALTEADAVTTHGALLCTVCFPSAPVEWTNFYETQAAAKKAARCPGSGTRDYTRETARLGYAAGNYGTCSHCGQNTTLTATNKLRGHKP